jgi:hypothetical protein
MVQEVLTMIHNIDPNNGYGPGPEPDVTPESKVLGWNGFKAKKTLLEACADERVDEVEGAFMDEGRVFIHLVSGYKFSESGEDDYDATVSRSVGSAQDVRDAMKTIIKTD